MGLGKLVCLTHLGETARCAAGLSSQIAQAAARDIAAIDAQKVDKADFDEAMAQLYRDIFSGEIPTALCSQAGDTLTTDSESELQAVRKIKKGSG